MYDFITYLKQLVEDQKKYKSIINHLLYLFDQLINILSILHRAELTLCGDFSPIVLKNDILKVNLMNMTTALPITLEQGICLDFKSFKGLLLNCTQAFVAARSKEFSGDVN